MATGKIDIFSRTSGRAAAAPSKAKETKQEKPKIVSVCLGPKQLIELDRLALKYREEKGRSYSRSEIIRDLLNDLLTNPEPLKRLQEIEKGVHISSF